MAVEANQTDGQKLVGYWIDRLDESEKWQRNWLANCRRIVRRYKNVWRDSTQDNNTNDDDDLGQANGRRRYSILWSNIQTLQPAVYARTPKPLVSRRYKDPDPVGKVVADVLERALEFAIDTYDFDDRMQLTRDDYLLLARGQVWVRYVPHVGVGSPENEEIEEASEGQITGDQENEGAADQIAYQEVLCDHVAYDDWGMEPCRNWSETGYVWRRAYLTREQLIERFGEKLGREIPLDWKPKTEESRESQTVDDHKAQIYEIWNKPDGEVIWISRGYTKAALDRRADPLGLKDFFPCPRPAMGTTPQDAYIPVPDYVFYQDQAQEVDELSQRIGKLIDALQIRGFYAAEEGMNLNNLFASGDNMLIPVNGFESLQDKGGAKGIVEWFPVEQVIETLKACIETRRQMLEDIYQITGISDILRGASDPRETATAQTLKGQWGALRVRDKQRELQRFARDVLDIKAQIIASKFGVDTLKTMTDVKLLTNAEKAQIQQMMALHQQAMQSSQSQGLPPPPPPPIPPEAQQLMEQPSWEDVMGLMRDKARLQFRIDIETDSTIEPDEAASKQSFVEYVGALSQLLTVASTIVPGAPYTAPLFGEIAKQSARVFNVSPTLEDVIDKVFSTAEQQPPAQAPGAGPTGPTPAEMQLKAAETQQAAQDSQQAHAVEAAKLQLQARDQQVQHALDGARLQLDAQGLQLKSQALARDPTPQGTA